MGAILRSDIYLSSKVVPLTQRNPPIIGFWPRIQSANGRDKMTKQDSPLRGERHRVTRAGPYRGIIRRGDPIFDLSFPSSAQLSSVYFFLFN